MLKCFLFVIAFILFCPVIKAQKENNFWFFGLNAGLNFNTNPVSAISGALTSFEGNSSISDQAGNLLFYTNGATVWDKNNAVMPNGSGLFGGESSSQSSIIVPLPNSCSKFYLFTTEDHMGNARFTYSIVDMCLNGGLGDVEVASKNSVIGNNISEKLTVIKHQNGIDSWILTHKLNSTEFHVYLVSSSGVSAPVISAVGANHTTLIGPVKANHDGSKIVTSISFANTCEMLDFNKSNGQISNPINLVSQYSLPGGVYGIEFSPDNNVLYISTFWGTSSLYQIDLLNSSVVLLSSLSGNYLYGGLQLGPDNRIYMARTSEQFLSIINYPNLVGNACFFQDNGITLLSGTLSQLGMHNMPSGHFYQSTNTNFTLGNDTTMCSSQSLNLKLISPLACLSSFIWSDGSSSDSLSINNSGIYWVDVNNGCFSFRDSISITYLQSPVVNLGNDTTLCVNENIELDAFNAGTTYLWSDNSTDTTLTITQPGMYWVDVSNGTCAIADSITISFMVCDSTTIEAKCSFDFETMLIPNIITVNGDQINDVFILSNKSSCIDKLLILNRWGNIIYESSPYKNDFEALDLNDGFYFYIYYPDVNMDSVRKNGSLYITKD